MEARWVQHAEQATHRKFLFSERQERESKVGLLYFIMLTGRAKGKVHDE